MIRIQNLSKSYRRLEALQDVSFDVPDGSAFALIGANGAGKTTILKILLNMLEADSGSASLMGVDSRRLSAAQLQRIGYVSENQKLPDGLKVDEFFRYLRPMYPDWDRQLEADLRKQFRLPGQSRIRDLSHGTRLKLTLACALAYRPQLLVLDEPLGGLDPLARDEVMEGMLAQAGETTILISSHELAEIEGTLTHVAYLDRGRLRFVQPLADLNSRFREIHVTLPPDAGSPESAKSWYGFERRGDVVQFVETSFDASNYLEKIRSILGEVRSIQAQPMSLRAIFVAMARHEENGEAL